MTEEFLGAGEGPADEAKIRSWVQGLGWSQKRGCTAA